MRQVGKKIILAEALYVIGEEFSPPKSQYTHLNLLVVRVTALSP